MQEITGGASKAVRLSLGEAVKLVNTHGSQVVDTWCLNAADPSEYLSVEHTRRMLFALFPRAGDTLYSNRRTPLLELEADSSGCDRLALEPPLSKPGDFIVLRALAEVVVVFSACPMDITPVNGDRIPRSVAYDILGNRPG